MSFISILKDIGRVFTNPVAQDVEKIALPVLGTVFPGLGPLLTGVSDVIGVIQKSSTTGTVTLSNDQKLSTALTLAEQMFTDFETSNGIKIPAENKAGIVSKVVDILNLIPTTAATGSNTSQN